jgi:deoxyribose-phosphate aldolase
VLRAKQVHGAMWHQAQGQAHCTHDSSLPVGARFRNDDTRVPSCAMDLQYRHIAKMLDHAILRPSSTDGEIEAGCNLARQLDVASVCVVPYGLRRCAELLAGSSVLPTTTIGFPHGSGTTPCKAREAEQAIALGGKELDMVVNIGKVLSGDYTYVTNEIAVVLRAVRDGGAKLKVIFENCYLERAHKLALLAICSELDVDWVKTSTGFGSGGATPEDVQLMREHAAPAVQVKASGGIRSLDQVLEMRALGASRVGTSATELILAEFRARAASQK